jgi:phosphatidate phosphatase APP1
MRINRLRVAAAQAADVQLLIEGPWNLYDLLRQFCCLRNRDYGGLRLDTPGSVVPKYIATADGQMSGPD